MSTVTTFLTSETGISILLWVLGLGWGALRASDLWTKYTKNRFDKAIETIFAGVKQTYDTQVAPIQADGSKLTLVQKHTARTTAINIATKIAAAKGIDLPAVVGEENLNVWVERAVNSLKGKTAPRPGH